MALIEPETGVLFGSFRGTNLPVPEGGISNGEVVLVGGPGNNERIVFAFSEQDPASPDDGGAGTAMQHQLRPKAELWTPVYWEPQARIRNIATGTGTATFTAFQNVFWDMTAAEPTDEKTGNSYWIGTALEDRDADTPEMAIFFNGQWPHRSA